MTNGPSVALDPLRCSSFIVSRLPRATSAASELPPPPSTRLLARTTAGFWLLSVPLKYPFWGMKRNDKTGRNERTGESKETDAPLRWTEQWLCYRNEAEITLVKEREV
jgi:hypothetical protein